MKEANTFANWGSLTVRSTTGLVCEAAKKVEMPKKEGENGKSEEGENVPNI